MSYNSRKIGWAEYNHITQLANDWSTSEGTENINLRLQKFAEIFTPVLSSEIITFDNDSVLSDLTLQTNTLVPIIKELCNKYLKVVELVDTDTYIAHADVGSNLSSSVWRAQKIDILGNRKWANNGEFTCVATSLSSLTYSY